MTVSYTHLLVLTMGLMTGLGATQVFADDEKVYKIACDQAYAPFSIQQDDGSYKGIDVELDVYKRQFESVTGEKEENENAETTDPETNASTDNAETETTEASEDAEE